MIWTLILWSMSWQTIVSIIDIVFAKLILDCFFTVTVITHYTTVAVYRGWNETDAFPC